ncbi:hypothetical protein H4R33_003919 [Dimargaris cristalligena]|uniref:WD40-repeat-containing domain protein n=1 Tax=Dimargaris cristalligena TaxID=215637 RepID=A0A4P9ZV83_9FUNG|nr:hypothetical protein H4R33_003919 [Dimargaris cristalligena]RKP36831.1 WD40-repeat-containing domain protein [Dimargaris cristalligena]|eukprot:RKP36831.1 WD40-repeat-containing domain protein [Dimargaris cristalligena]
MSQPGSIPRTKALTLTGHKGAVNVARFNSDGKYCLTGGQDRQIRLWKVDTGEKVVEFEGHARDVLDLQVSPDNSRFASVGNDRAVFLWDVATQRIIKKCDGHLHRINTVGFSPNSALFASGSLDKTVRIWDNRSNSRRPVQQLEEATDSVTTLAFNDTEMLTGSADGFVRVYDMRQGQMTADFTGSPVTSGAWSADNRCILIGALDHTLRLFDRSNGTLLNHYEGHQSSQFKMECCFSRSGAHVISGSEDGAIWFWDILEASRAQRVLAHSSIVTCVAYHPTESALLSSSSDGSVIIWR